MEESFKKIKNIPLKVTNWIGTTGSLVAHTLLFVAALLMPHFGIISFDDMLLFLTMIVSLEAIYLSIFIQMTVNRHMESLEEVQEDVQEISQDVEEISVDMDKIREEEKEEEVEGEKTKITFEKIETGLQKLLTDIETLKQQNPK